VIAGGADQGSGAVFLLDVAASASGGAGGALPIQALPEPAPSPGLDDAPYFSAFSASGRWAAVSNESWGGCGVLVYDVVAGQPLWSKVLDHSCDDAEDWYPFALAFTSDDELLLVARPGAIVAYRAADGAALGTLPFEGDGKAGFAVESARRRVWIPTGDGPQALELPDSWR
jgi:hypothetical protein